MARTLNCSIDAMLFSRFPQLTIGAFVADSLDRAASALAVDQLEGTWDLTIRTLKGREADVRSLERLRQIQLWRDAFAACGATGPHDVGSVERIVRVVLQHGAALSFPPLVGLSAALSARHLAPLHGYDVDSIPAEQISLRAPRPDFDWFVPLGAAPSDIPITDRGVVFAAGRTVMSWLFNRCDSRQTCLHSRTSRGMFVSEAIAAEQLAASYRALIEMRDRLAFLGARVGTLQFANLAAPEFVLTIEETACC